MICAPRRSQVADLANGFKVINTRIPAAVRKDLLKLRLLCLANGVLGCLLGLSLFFRW
jgi:hypothetical protein